MGYPPIYPYIPRKSALKMVSSSITDQGLRGYHVTYTCIVGLVSAGERNSRRKLCRATFSDGYLMAAGIELGEVSIRICSLEAKDFMSRIVEISLTQYQLLGVLNPRSLCSP
jgi:hypothetical protein